MCQFWNKGASKRFVEIMYSIKEVKIEVFFSSLNEWSPYYLHLSQSKKIKITCTSETERSINWYNFSEKSLKYYYYYYY